MLPPCGLAPSPMPCDDFLPTNLTGNSLPTGRGPARNAAAETEKSLQRFNLIYFSGTFIGPWIWRGFEVSRDEISPWRFFPLRNTPARPRKNLGGKLWSPLFGSAVQSTGSLSRQKLLLSILQGELAAYLPVGGQRLEIHDSRFGIKSQSDDSVREIKAIVSGAGRET